MYYGALFKVDTGADTSTISKLELFKLGYDMSWIRDNVIVLEGKDRPITASGDAIDAGYIQLPQLNILGYEGKCWPFQITTREDQDFKNLLGRDLLTGFNYQFSNDNEVFTISRAKRFNPQYAYLPGQEIHELASD